MDEIPLLFPPLLIYNRFIVTQTTVSLLCLRERERERERISLSNYLTTINKYPSFTNAMLTWFPCLFYHLQSSKGKFCELCELTSAQIRRRLRATPFRSIRISIAQWTLALVYRDFGMHRQQIAPD